MRQSIAIDPQIKNSLLGSEGSRRSHEKEEPFSTCMDEESSLTMSQALKDGLLGPLRPQWIQAIVFFAVGGLVNFYVPPHEKMISAIPDPQLSYPVGEQQFPEWLLFAVGYVMPLILIFVVARFFDKADFCISALALSQSIALALLTTAVAKKMAGRPRPCFVAMCGWVSNSSGIGHCTAPKLQQWESRQSFPSGHSSFSMAGLAYLAMYLLEKCEQVQRQSKFNGLVTATTLHLQAAQLASLLPIAVAIWIAISRTTDYWHDYSDVLAGSVLGFGIAYLSFGQRGRFRSILEDERKREERESLEAPDGRKSPDSDEIRETV